MKFPAAHIRIAIVGLVSILVLIGLVVRENQARAAGREVIMSMMAVDPRDALTGHYVAIDLREKATGTCFDTNGHERWLALAPSNGRWHVVGQSEDRAAVEKLAPVTVRGRTTCSNNWMDKESEHLLTTDLGVKRFHIAQGGAERIEKLLRDNRGNDDVAAAILSIGKDGKARLKGVIVPGGRFELSLF